MARTFHHLKYELNPDGLKTFLHRRHRLYRKERKEYRKQHNRNFRRKCRRIERLAERTQFEYVIELDLPVYKGTSGWLSH